MFFFSYLFSNCFEITVELSCCKYPDRKELVNQWNFNKKSLVRFVNYKGLSINDVTALGLSRFFDDYSEALTLKKRDDAYLTSFMYE